MKTSRFAMTALFCGLSMVAASSVFAAPPLKLQRITMPMMLIGSVKLPLDWCDPLGGVGGGCGKFVAEKFCAQNYPSSKLQSFVKTSSPLPKTKTLSGQICPGGPYKKCYGFAQITCAVPAP